MYRKSGRHASSVLHAYIMIFPEGSLQAPSSMTSMVPESLKE